MQLKLQKLYVCISSGFKKALSSVNWSSDDTNGPHFDTVLRPFFSEGSLHLFWGDSVCQKKKHNALVKTFQKMPKKPFLACFVSELHLRCRKIGHNKFFWEIGRICKNQLARPKKFVKINNFCLWFVLFLPENLKKSKNQNNMWSFAIQKWNFPRHFYYIKFKLGQPEWIIHLKRRNFLVFCSTLLSGILAKTVTSKQFKQLPAATFELFL